MTANPNLKFVFLVIAFTFSQLVFAQTALSDVNPQTALSNPAQEVMPAKKVSVRVEWATILDFSFSKTETNNSWPEDRTNNSWPEDRNKVMS